MDINPFGKDTLHIINKPMLHPYILAGLIFLTFSILSASCFFFMRKTEHKHLNNDVQSILANAQTSISSNLFEMSTLLSAVSQSVQSIISEGGGEEQVRGYLKSVDEEIIKNSKNSMFFLNLQGYFEIFDNAFIENEIWSPAQNAAVAESEWYKAAIKANGKMVLTKPYMDKYGFFVVSYGICLVDEKKNPLAALSISLPIERVVQETVDAQLSKNSYGIMFGEDFYVIAHPDLKYLGTPIDRMRDGVEIKNEIIRYGYVFERKTVDYRGNAAVAFFKILNNGWYIGVLTPIAEYYENVGNLAVFIFSFSFIASVVFSVVLINTSVSKNKADQYSRMIFNSVPIACSLWDKNHNIVACNVEELSLYGVANKQECQKRFFDLSPKFQPNQKLSEDMFMENLDSVLASGVPMRFEWMHQGINGEPLPCDIIIKRIKYGKKYILAAYKYDLRKIKDKEFKLVEADERMRIMLDSTPLACCLLDSDYSVMDCNQEALNMFNIRSKQEFFEKLREFSPLFQPNGKPSEKLRMEYIEKTVKTGRNNFEWTYQTLNGETLPCDITLTRVNYNNRQIIAVYIKDLRQFIEIQKERRNVEIAQESNKAKSKFLAAMSHEIRTPMNVILGIAEILLQDENLSLDVKESISKIYNSADLLLGIINDILDLSKIDAGKMEIIPEKYDVASLVCDMVNLNIMRSNKPIKFSLKIDENIPCILLGDKLRIKQILNNLLANAFKFTDKGKVTLSIYGEKGKTEDEVALLFKVSDTGIGMSADEIDKIFVEYSRFSNRLIEGTGLGMSIARNLVEAMNGEISVESRPNKGTTFTVRLPQKIEDGRIIGKESAQNLERFRFSGITRKKIMQINREYMPYGTVLIVDDAETNLYVAKGLMTPYGLHIDTATSGFQAINKINDGKVYDIIFMDHMMPKMDGIETVKKIRETGYKETIVALTANALSGQSAMFISNGFDDFISKPIDVRKLDEILNLYVRDRQPPEIIEEARRQKINETDGVKTSQSSVELLTKYFCRDARKAVNVMETILKNMTGKTANADDDLRLFAVNAHTMKSALANIGENELSKKAADMEKAAKEQNYSAIFNNAQELTDAIKSIIEKIEELPDETPQIQSEDTQVLNRYLQTIYDACGQYDGKAASAAILELKEIPWTAATKRKIDEIFDYLLHSDFEEAAQLAKNMIEKNEG